MGKYVALLRGVNVGGKNKIAMPLLKKAFEAIGFAEVKTYINSGNIIFSSDCEDKIKLKDKCEAAIADQFMLRIAVTIVSAKELADALQHAPCWWDNDDQSKHNAIFVIPPATAAQVIEHVGAIKPEYEQIGAHGQIIFWSAPIQTFSRTRLTKIVSTSDYHSITIRNANTAKKLGRLTE